MGLNSRVAKQPTLKKQKKSVEPRPLPEPRPRGIQEQHLADAPCGARHKYCFLDTRALRLRLVVFGEAETNATRYSRCYQPSSDCLFLVGSKVPYVDPQSPDDSN